MVKEYPDHLATLSTFASTKFHSNGIHCITETASLDRCRYWSELGFQEGKVVVFVSFLVRMATLEALLH
jgi:hypothetical protein